MDNPKVRVQPSSWGDGLFAIENIQKGEIIAEFDGERYEAEKCTDLPKNIADYAVQFAPHQWRDSDGFARKMNHSCQSNVGFSGLFTLVTMRDIKAGEELFLDYNMSENSDWRMQCSCGNADCRKIIGSYNNLPTEIREKYNGYISEWLR